MEEVEPVRPATDALATIAPRDDPVTAIDETSLHGASLHDTAVEDTPLLRFTFTPTADAPAIARGRAAMVLDGSPHVDVVLVLVSELVTNAVLHARGLAQLTIVCRHVASATRGSTEEVIRVEVRDSHDHMPESRPNPGAHGGFGLRIVAAMAREWGYVPLANGKIVWFEVGGASRPRRSCRG